MSNEYRATDLENLGKYQDIIFQHSIAAATTGGTIGAILPGVDIAGVAAIWVTMIGRIAQKADNYAEDATIQKFIINLLQGAGSYMIGSIVLRLLLMSTGIGILGAAALNAMLNFLYTARLGIFAAEQFDRPGFEMKQALLAVDSIQKIIFAVPTVEELKFAFQVTKEHDTN